MGAKNNMSRADRLYSNPPVLVRDEASGQIVVRRPPKVEEPKPTEKVK